MRTVRFGLGASRSIVWVIVSFVFATAAFLRADQVEMHNGDRYSGKIVGMDDSHVVLKSEILGTLRIRRDKVTSIQFGTPPIATANAETPHTTTNSSLPKAPPVPVVSSSPGGDSQIDFSSSISQQLAANPGLVNEVRSQVLAGAGPKALMKFDSLVGGLSSGSLNIGDVRKEAASVAAQLRELRGNEDDATADIFDEYLALLDSFVAATQKVDPPKTPPVSSNATQSVPPTPQPKPVDARDSGDPDLF